MYGDRSRFRSNIASFTLMPKPPFQLFVVVPPGLEALAAAELRDAGQPVEIVRGGLSCTAGWEGLMAAHLHSRIASRVLVRVARFGARALGELERKAGEVDWAAWIPSERLRDPSDPIPVDVSCGRSRLYHEGAVRERVLRAIGREPSDPAPSNAPGAWRLHVRVHRDTITISLDATGDHLHRRGYRRLTGSAPLRETLAAAALRASGWPFDRPLLDPFAGSGTIVIEGALMARRIPPALATASRQPPEFPFLEWEGAPAATWTDEVGRARDRILPGAPAPILASDRDARSLEALAGNARAAGVEEDLSVEQASMTRASMTGGDAGWIVTNPPYGGRLGERSQLRPLYRSLGSQLAGPWSDWAFCAYVSDPVLEGALRRELSRRGAGPLESLVKTRNGGIPVTLVGRPMPPLPGPPGDP
ncbi:MAG: hypothetical protein EA351_09290 [Gemmatimonadales bacterium]|nr:MAG: hypothetical protein EA351_09290 [Gemmatimonadales bacterium]